MIPRYGEWDRRFRERGLTVVGVHAPESAAERDVANLAEFVRAHAIRWPVVLDPDLAAWRAFDVRAWPTMVLIGRDGTLRGRFVGDGSGAAIEAALVAQLDAP